MADLFEIALVLSGGNALGVYQAGACQALAERGLEPDWVVGASAGAINGALFCGNAPAGRIAQLRAFWGMDDRADHPDPAWAGTDETRRTGAALATAAGGRPGLFVPRHLFGPWWNPFGTEEPASLYDTTPLAATLDTLADWTRLNTGTPRFSVTALDLNTGEDVVFDSGTHAITPAHIRASSALLPAFAPVEIDGRLLGDGGISANLPVDSVLASPATRPRVVIAIDLLPLSGPRPRTLGDSLARVQDLAFASQSRRSIAAWQAIHDAAATGGGTAPITLIHLAYADQEREVSGKAFDYSPPSVARRWHAGHRDCAAALDRLRDGSVDIGAPGLSVYRPVRSPAGPAGLEPVRWSLAPVPG